LRAVLAARAVEISIDGQTIGDSKTHVDATSGTRKVTEWALHSEEQ
jgi:hypothetical protein